jgi:hypothetical protein
MATRVMPGLINLYFSWISRSLYAARARYPSFCAFFTKGSHLDDPFVKKAQKEGYRARAAYKLLEIQEKYKLINLVRK